MSAKVLLALAGPGDLDALLPMLERFNASQGYPFELAHSRATLSALLARAELGRAYRIVQGSETLGYAVLTFGYSLEWGGRDAFVDEIFVEAEHRGRGVGRAALRELTEQARGLGVRALHLEVEAGNPAGQSLYRSEGFADGGRHLLSRRVS
jgi:ribosomal protein S18 acetylase RimI-like enzyme